MPMQHLLQHHKPRNRASLYRCGNLQSRKSYSKSVNNYKFVHSVLLSNSRASYLVSYPRVDDLPCESPAATIAPLHNSNSHLALDRNPIVHVYAPMDHGTFLSYW